eukprot:9717761-Heterocapsa_arctica.AAC.1
MKSCQRSWPSAAARSCGRAATGHSSWPSYRKQSSAARCPSSPSRERGGERERGGGRGGERERVHTS